MTDDREYEPDPGATLQSAAGWWLDILDRLSGGSNRDDGRDMGPKPGLNDIAEMPDLGEEPLPERDDDSG